METKFVWEPCYSKKISKFQDFSVKILGAIFTSFLDYEYTNGHYKQYHKENPFRSQLLYSRAVQQISPFFSFNHNKPNCRPLFAYILAKKTARPNLYLSKHLNFLFIRNLLLLKKKSIREYFSARIINDYLESQKTYFSFR